MNAITKNSRLRTLTWLASVALLLGATATATAAGSIATDSSATAFKIFLTEPGVYRVTYEDLAKAGLSTAPASGSLGLENRDRPVPIFLADGGDGHFGPGDHLEFVGDRLAGEVTYFNEHSNLNVYRLRLDADAGGATAARMTPPAGGAASQAAPVALSARQHFEHDQILLRFPGREDRPQELWYWVKLTQLDDPFRQTVDLSDLATTDLDPTDPRPIRLTVEIRGWSQPARKAPLLTDHAVEITFGGKPVASATWNNPDGMQRITAEIPAASVSAGKNEIGVRIPVRPNAETGESLIDVSVLNSIEIVYPRSRAVNPGNPSRLEVSDAAAVATLSIPAGSLVTLYGEAGSRIPGIGVARRPEPNRRESAAFQLPQPETVLWAVARQALSSPVAVERDRPSSWAKFAEPVDYLIIAHPRLLAAIEPLAELHRKRGLKVAVVDVEDLYDEWNGGILDPQAIKDFLRHAWRDFPKPAPRFVLLVGDASWDPKNLHTSDDAEDEQYVDSAYSPGHGTEFAKIVSTPYSERGALDHRNLVPTWNYGTFDGHAAGDNWFVDVEGDDLKPEMAIGRLPVIEPEEVAAIVAKTAAYLDRPEIGSWRREVVWVTNEEPVMQGWSDEMARDLAPRGFAARKVYPKPEVEGAPHPEQDQQHLVEALGAGELLVHFIGHGGRFIWRTGPPDWTKHRDLFNLSDLDKLPESRRLPVVLSMTCYSAPFDHPTADSIGEKFLRLPKKGAIAVIAASWRNSPYKQMSESLIKNLLAPGATIGEALQKTKRECHDDEFVKQYNLLGDPALPLALPDPLVLTANSRGAGDAFTPAFTIRHPEGETLAGKATIDWLDETGAVLATEEHAAKGTGLDLVFPGKADVASAVRSARVYLWDSSTGRDAAGAVALPQPPAVETPSK